MNTSLLPQHPWLNGYMQGILFACIIATIALYFKLPFWVPILSFVWFYLITIITSPKDFVIKKGE